MPIPPQPQHRGLKLGQLLAFNPSLWCFSPSQWGLENALLNHLQGWGLGAALPPLDTSSPFHHPHWKAPRCCSVDGFGGRGRASSHLLPPCVWRARPYVCPFCPTTLIPLPPCPRRGWGPGPWVVVGLLVSVVQLCLSYPIWMPPLPPISLPCFFCRWSPTQRCLSRWDQTC